MERTRDDCKREEEGEEGEQEVMRPRAGDASAVHRAVNGVKTSVMDGPAAGQIAKLAERQGRGFLSGVRVLPCHKVEGHLDLTQIR